ncbi:transposase [Cryobacterium sp. TMT2-10]|uniref:transposase n=1 Tax=Cryobacterium sp. TMT2-10 TaxID=1259244 RepID=UPI0035191A14
MAWGSRSIPLPNCEYLPRALEHCGGQTCVVHLLRASFRYAARQDLDKIAKILKPVYTAATVDAAEERFLEFVEAWGKKYLAIVRMWEASWAEFVPFLQFDAEIRRVVCTTNAIESVNARIRKAVRARGHFPNELTALKCVYLAVMSLDPTGQGRARWTHRWKAVKGHEDSDVRLPINVWGCFFSFRKPARSESLATARRELGVFGDDELQGPVGGGL